MTLKYSKFTDFNFVISECKLYSNPMCCHVDIMNTCMSTRCSLKRRIINRNLRNKKKELKYEVIVIK